MEAENYGLVCWRLDILRGRCRLAFVLDVTVDKNHRASTDLGIAKLLPNGGKAHQAKLKQCIRKNSRKRVNIFQLLKPTWGNYLSDKSTNVKT